MGYDLHQDSCVAPKRSPLSCPKQASEPLAFGQDCPRWADSQTEYASKWTDGYLGCTSARSVQQSHVRARLQHLFSKHIQHNIVSYSAVYETQNAVWGLNVRMNCRENVVLAR